jgi:ABC-type branched-subunit amino acid transport system ATPase component
MSALLELHDVSRAFGGIKAVDGVGFSVAEGEWVGVAGPNGAGKSTLLNCISGVAGHASGRIAFDGQRISGMRPSRVARLGMARAFQTIDRFSGCTAGEFVALGRLGQRNASVWKSVFNPRGTAIKERESRVAVHRALRDFGLDRFEHLEMRELPYGVRKMVDVVRVLVSQPRLVLLDEPTSGSSARERLMLREMMQSLRAQGITAVVVDHDIGFLSACSDRVVAMAAGRKLIEGLPDAVFSSPEVVRSYLGEQAKSAEPSP